MSVRSSSIPLTLLVGTIVVALGCRDASPVGVAGLTRAGTPIFHDLSSDDDDGEASDTTDDDDPDDDSLLTCRPLRYDSVTKTIGPAGGEIAVGRNWLLVPRGALREPVRITAVAPSDTVTMVRFQPEGLRFEATALLVMKYDNCRVPKGVTPRIALVTESLSIIEVLASGDDMLS